MQVRKYILGLGLAAVLSAQPFLYNEAKDQAARQAEATARDIGSGAVFAKELQNWNMLSRLEIERVMSFAQVQFRAGINAFVTWKDVAAQLDKVESEIARTGQTLSGDEAARRLAGVKKRVEAVQASIRKLQEAAGGGSDVVEQIQANLTTASSVLAFASQLPSENQGFAAALEHINAWLDTAKSLYDSFATAWAARQTTKSELATLQRPREAEGLRLLRLEMQHLQWTGQNAARQELETASVLGLVESARNKLRVTGLAGSGDRISSTFEGLAEQARTAASENDRVAARDRLFLLLIALHEAAAARSQFNLPRVLGELRDTQEEWRYSTLKSAARVQAAEQAIRDSATRLALYYKGGIKPAQIAQLLYNLSGLVSLPIIAAK
jgi:hypothetical protein